MEKILTVYKASAGSGKTFTLTAEYIALIIKSPVENHRQVLAVTFTNKATGEMKERILQKLWELAYCDPIESVDIYTIVKRKCSHLDSDEIKCRSKKALHEIIHDYDYFHVETIDSFFQSLLTSLAHELGLPASAGVEIDEKRVVEQAVNDMIRNISTKGRIAGWFVGYMNEKIMDGKAWNVTDEVKKLAKLTSKEIFLKHEDALLKIYDNEELIASFRELLMAVKQKAGIEFKQQIQKIVEAIEGMGGFDIFSRGCDPKKRLDYMLSLGKYKPPTASHVAKINDYTAWIKSSDKKKGKLTDEAIEFCNLLSRSEQIFKEFGFVSNSVNITLKYINPLRLIGEIGREIKRINSENNRFPLYKTPLLFDELVQKSDASFVFEKAGTTFHHIMIDEFQDTSSIQWSNFKRLLIENMSTGNSCMLVGDVKQSIYRFRGGDWKILSNIEKENGLNDIQLCHLDTNYRTCLNIVNFNNHLFSSASEWLSMAGNKDVMEHIYADVIQKGNKKRGGYVEMFCRIKPNKQRKKENADYRLADNDSRQESMCVDDDLARKIEQLHACGIPYTDMTILVRYNKDANAIVEAFSRDYPSIKLVSDEAFWFSSSMALNVIICMMRCCVDEGDDVAYEFVAKFVNRISRSQNVSQLQSDSNSFIIDDTDTWRQKFDAEIRKLKKMPLFEFCEHVITLFSLNSLDGESPFLLAFLDDVMTYLENGSGDMNAFLEYWNEVMKAKPIPSSEVDGVRVMTIHKSKGLESRVIFIPSLDWHVEKDRNNDIAWCEPVDEPYNTFPIIPTSQTSQMENSTYAKDYENEHFDRRVENLNLAYVAFTRAKEFLYVWCEVRENTSVLSKDLTIGEVLYKSIEGDFSGSGDIKRISCGEERNLLDDSGSLKHGEEPQATINNPLNVKPEPEKISMAYYPLKARFRQSNAAIQFVSDADSLDETNYMDQGKLIHYLFSLITCKSDLEMALKSLMLKGVVSSEEKINELRLFVQKRLRNPVAGLWFDSQWNVYNECNLLLKDEDGCLVVKRPDRVVTNQMETIVIDYKCAKEREEHREQVAEYCDFLRKMGHKKVTGYVWYLYEDKLCKVENSIL